MLQWKCLSIRPLRAHGRKDIHQAKVLPPLPVRLAATARTVHNLVLLDYPRRMARVTAPRPKEDLSTILRAEWAKLRR